MPNSLQNRSRLIKNEAERLGFMFCGISKADFLESEAPKLEQWLQKGYHGAMQYMENHFDKRLDPRKLVDGAKSVISLAYNYFPAETQEDSEAPKIARYAYGQDYHHVLKGKLKELVHCIESEIGEVNGRAFVDSAPVMERQWAEKSGVGWIGKNSLLLNKKVGSYFFLAELILDLEIEEDGPVQDHCGTCTKCIDACPTDAIVGDGIVNASKCISYFTIELKGEIPSGLSDQFENWMFGCDICQEVCPWNRFAKAHNEPAFQPKPGLITNTAQDWEELTKEVFNEIFRKSAVKRTKFEGLKRNIAYLKRGNKKSDSN